MANQTDDETAAAVDREGDEVSPSPGGQTPSVETAVPPPSSPTAAAVPSAAGSQQVELDENGEGAILHGLEAERVERVELEPPDSAAWQIQPHHSPGISRIVLAGEPGATIAVTVIPK